VHSIFEDKIVILTNLNKCISNDESKIEVSTNNTSEKKIA